MLILSYSLISSIFVWNKLFLDVHSDVYRKVLTIKLEWQKRASASAYSPVLILKLLIIFYALVSLSQKILNLKKGARKWVLREEQMDEILTQWSEKQYLGRTRLFGNFESKFFSIGSAVNLEGSDLFWRLVYES